MSSHFPKSFESIKLSFKSSIVKAFLIIIKIVSRDERQRWSPNITINGLVHYKKCYDLIEFLFFKSHPLQYNFPSYSIAYICSSIISFHYEQALFTPFARLCLVWNVRYAIEKQNKVLSNVMNIKREIIILTCKYEVNYLINNNVH